MSNRIDIIARWIHHNSEAATIQTISRHARIGYNECKDAIEIIGKHAEAILKRSIEQAKRDSEHAQKVYQRSLARQAEMDKREAERVETSRLNHLRPADLAKRIAELERKLDGSA